MKGAVFVLCGVLWLGFTFPAQAASFDCAKAQLPAEKFVCGNQFISALDDKLDAVYRSVLSKASADEKQQVITQQKHWLKHTRNVCTQEVCFKHAYWTRQAELATFFEPKSPLYAKEADKVQDIKKVLMEATWYKGTQSDPMCRQVFSALKQMKGISFVDPAVQTMSYEDPALDSWKGRARQTLFAKKCVPNVPLTFRYFCIPPFHNDNIGNDADSSLLECEAWYGLPPFKIFVLPPLKPREKTRYIFYQDSVYGPMNKKEISRYPHVGSSDFSEFFTEKCGSHDKGVYVSRGLNKYDGPNFNSVFIYQQRYFILALEHDMGVFWLETRPIDVNATCSWTTFNPQVNK
jgi:uncharacterized protein